MTSRNDGCHTRGVKALAAILLVGPLAISACDLRGTGHDDNPATDQPSAGGATAPTGAQTQSPLSEHDPTGQYRHISSYTALEYGRSSHQAAWQAALADTPPGGTLILSPGATYVLPTNVVIPHAVKIQGQGATVLMPPGGSPVGPWFTIAGDDVSIRDVVFRDPHGLVRGSVVFSQPGVDRLSVSHNSFYSQEATAVRAQASNKLVVEHNRFDGVKNAIQVSGPSTETSIQNNMVTRWQNFGIHVNGTATGAPSGVSLSGNRITDLTPAGYPRYPIHIAQGGAAARLQNVEVTSNTVIGPGTSYVGSPAGTADQISLHNIDGLTVEGNVSRGSGDMGITVESTSATTVKSNVVTESDASGIAIFTGVTAAHLTGNTVFDNGRNRVGNRPPAALAGIRVASSSAILPKSVTISKNTTGNASIPSTQLYGISAMPGADVRIFDNIDLGNVRTEVNVG